MRAIHVAVAILIAGYSHAQTTVFAIKGVKLGDSKKEVVAKHRGLLCAEPTSCMHLNYGHPRTKTPSLDTFAGAEVKTWIFLFSKSGALESTRITFASSDVDTIVHSLTEKYGPPTTKKTAEFKTAMGLNVVQTTTRWLSGDGFLSVVAPDRVINESTLELTSRAAQTRRVEEYQQKLKQDM